MGEGQRHAFRGWAGLKGRPRNGWKKSDARRYRRYGRAARLIDQLEHVGVVGAPEGTEPRAVLKNEQELDKWLTDRSGESGASRLGPTHQFAENRRMGKRMTAIDFARRIRRQIVRNSVIIAAVFPSLLCSVDSGFAQDLSGGPSVTAVATTDRFEFYSDPWINLHHFLYQWARDAEGLATGRRHVPVPERASIAELSDVERRAWLQAVAFYQRSVAQLSHFDREMLRQQGALLELAGDLQAEAPDVIPGIGAALTIAMPVYLSEWWPAHDLRNRAWIASVEPFVRRHEGRFVELTRRIYDAEWWSTPRRVDVSAYANARAGYTARGHTIIYSTDAGNQDLYGVETLLHEVQHTREVGRNARVELATAFEVAEVDRPDNLWHSLIFATAGAFVRSMAEQEGLPEHVPYWIREGFQNFQGWEALVPAVRQHWLPVVRGNASREDGYAALARFFKSD